MRFIPDELDKMIGGRVFVSTFSKVETNGYIWMKDRLEMVFFQSTDLVLWIDVF